MDAGHQATLWTVRAAAVLYVLALHAWFAHRDERARFLWTGGFLLYLLHVAAAFQFHHHWSHSAAYEDTARQTAQLFGVESGWGIYCNYLFTAVWALDVGWWWGGLEGYRYRPRPVGAWIHGYMAFMFFNGVVVFGSSTVRWVGLAMTAFLLWTAWRGSTTRD